MKRILISLLLCSLIATPGLAESTSSAADDFLANLSATWDSLVQLGGEAVDSASNWINNDLPYWINNDLPIWADSASQSIQAWLDDAGKWTQDAAANLRTFVDENRPAVEAWLSQAGDRFQRAWEVLTSPEGYSSTEVQDAYTTVMDALKEAQPPQGK